MKNGELKMEETKAAGGETNGAIPETPAFASWAIVEVMGHRRMAGKVSEQMIAGVPFLRVEVPTEPVGFISPENGAEGQLVQLYRPGAIFAITPCDEATARKYARAWGPPTQHLAGLLESPSESRPPWRERENDDEFEGGYG